jgi:hypothetical protein
LTIDEIPILSHRMTIGEAILHPRCTAGDWEAIATLIAGRTDLAQGQILAMTLADGIGLVKRIMDILCTVEAEAAKFAAFENYLTATGGFKIEQI